MTKTHRHPIAKAMLVLVLTAPLVLIGPTLASARAKEKKELRTIPVDAYYTEPEGQTSTGGNCPSDQGRYTGHSDFTGPAFTGRAEYDLCTSIDEAGNLTYYGTEVVTGSVQGCGSGSFELAIEDGKIYTSEFNPLTQSVRGFNTWSITGGTGGLSGLVSGSGNNDWTNYPLDSKRFGEGRFTGTVTCWVPRKS